MAQEPRPNILFIHTDQQRGDCLGVEGHPVLLTPNMDGIAARGVRFTQFRSACPSCIATRRSILSGLNPQTHGLVGYREGVEWNPPATLPGVLAEYGYQTALIGRSMHQHPPDKPFGFQEMLVCRHEKGARCDYTRWLSEIGPRDSGGWMGGGVMHNDWTAKPYHLAERLHLTNWVVTRALEWLERRDPERPFFLAVGFVAPHPPLQPPAFYLERYLRTGVPATVIGDWAAPPVFGDESDLVSARRVDLRGDALLCARAAYYGLINHVDDQIRRLLNPVNGIERATGGNTIVVLVSDHGEMLGDHYLWRKSLAYEAAARVPFLISAPERFGLKRASAADALATHADIMPTLLEMAGIAIPDHLDGRSLLPWMRGETPRWREFLHIEHAPFCQALTDGREKYIWCPADGAEQFFCLETDPAECADLARDSSSFERIAVWRNRLIGCLLDRPEGFVRNGNLIPGRPYSAQMPQQESR